MDGWMDGWTRVRKGKKAGYTGGSETTVSIEHTFPGVDTATTSTEHVVFMWLFDFTEFHITGRYACIWRHGEL